MDSTLALSEMMMALSKIFCGTTGDTLSVCIIRLRELVAVVRVQGHCVQVDVIVGLRSVETKTKFSEHQAWP